MVGKNINDEILKAHIASRPVLKELAENGIRVRSLSELIHMEYDVNVAVPILVNWLSRIDNAQVKETIVRAITIDNPQPNPTGELILEYTQATNFGLKWAIGNALSKFADMEYIDDIITLVMDKENGKSREMLAVALGKFNDHRSISTLVYLLDDPQIAGHAIIGLRKLAPIEVKSEIESFLDHPIPWIRSEAKKAIEKINKKIK